MASIHSFMPRRPVAGRADRGPAGPAKIIIFPGIRYEREKANGSGAVGQGGGVPPGPAPVAESQG